MFLKLTATYSGLHGEILVVRSYAFANYYGEFISPALTAKN